MPAYFYFILIIIQQYGYFNISPAPPQMKIKKIKIKKTLKKFNNKIIPLIRMLQ